MLTKASARMNFIVALISDICRAAQLAVNPTTNRDNSCFWRIMPIGGRDKNLGIRRTKGSVAKPKRNKKRKEDRKEDSTGSVKTEEKMRRNALQIKEEVKAEEEIMAAKERAWETPTILRRGAI